MFVGREKEIGILKASLLEPSSAVMIYGKRKIGKTTLIKRYLTESGGHFVYYECLKNSIEENIFSFTKELVRKGILPASIVFPSFQELFAYLNSLPIELTIAIDEYPYLKAFSKPECVDSMFQNIIDERLSNIRLILSGSHVGMMRELLEERDALYGRFKSVIELKELNYLEASMFYPQKTSYEKAAFYSVFGGSPFVNSQLRPEFTLKENILNTILNPASSIFLYSDNLLLSDYSNRINAERIFAVLGNGRKHYGEIEQALGIERNGSLNRQLKAMTDMSIIAKSNPINRPDDAKKTLYFLDDNLMRFYYSYVYRNKGILEMLGAEQFYDEYIDKSLITFISHRFEAIAMNYFSILAHNGRLKGVRKIGSLYYDDPKSRKNGEFDLVLEKEDGYHVIEVKYFSGKLDNDTVKKEIGQIHSIPSIKVSGIGFVAANGFENSAMSQELEFCLDADDIYLLNTLFPLQVSIERT